MKPTSVAPALVRPRCVSDPRDSKRRISAARAAEKLGLSETQLSVLRSENRGPTPVPGIKVICYEIGELSRYQLELSRLAQSTKQGGIDYAESTGAGAKTDD